MQTPLSPPHVTLFPLCMRGASGVSRVVTCSRPLVSDSHTPASPPLPIPPQLHTLHLAQTIRNIWVSPVAPLTAITHYSFFSSDLLSQESLHNLNGASKLAALLGDREITNSNRSWQTSVAKPSPCPQDSWQGNALDPRARDLQSIGQRHR